MDTMDVQRFLEKTENKIPPISVNNHQMDENNRPINDYDYSLDDEFDVIRSIN